MAFTVRYPSGQAVTYNDATFLYHGNGSWEIYTKDKEKGGRCICVIQQSAGVAVEFVTPCKVENPLAKLTGESALDFVLANIEDLSRPYGGALKVAKLKTKLQKFSSRSKNWRRS
jgi:hypothetical protein